VYTELQNKRCWFAQNTHDGICTILACLLVCVFFNMPAVGLQTETKSYAIPFHVDLRHYVSTSLYVRCDVNEYNLPFTKLDFSNNEPAESQFSELLKSMHTGDLKKCSEKTLGKEGVPLELQKSLADRAESWALSWHSAYINEAVVGKDLGKLKVLSQFYLGEKVLFLVGGMWGDPADPQPFRLQFSFLPDATGSYLWNVQPPDALESLLGEMARHQASHPEDYIAVEDKACKYRIPIPWTKNTRHVAYVQFNGSHYDFDVVKADIFPKKGTTDEVVAFSQRKYLLIAGKSPLEEVAALYTERSREKYIEHLQKRKAKPEEYNQWYSNLLEDVTKRKRIVRFVIDANPLYIVMYKEEGRTSPLRQFIIRDPNTESLRFTQYFSSGFLDDLMNDKEFARNLAGIVLAEE